MIAVDKKVLMHLHDSIDLTFASESYNETFLLSNHLSAEVIEFGDSYVLNVQYEGNVNCTKTFTKNKNNLEIEIFLQITIDFFFFNHTGWWVLNQTEVTVNGETTKLSSKMIPSNLKFLKYFRIELLKNPDFSISAKRFKFRLWWSNCF